MGENHSRGFKNFPATNPVCASFNRRSGHEINFPVKNFLEFILHPDMIEQSPVSPVLEGYQDIHIALGAEIVTQDGTEQGQLTDAPTLAKSCNVGVGKGYYEILHCLFPNYKEVFPRILESNQGFLLFCSLFENLTKRLKKHDIPQAKRVGCMWLLSRFTVISQTLQQAIYKQDIPIV